MGLFSGIGSFFGGPIGGLLGGIGDDILGRDDAQQANTTAYQQQRELRQTAYQDTTADLQKAGLNPMLAYSNGATSAAAGPPVLNKGASSAQQNSAQASTQNINADTALKLAQARLTSAQEAKTVDEKNAIPQNMALQASTVEKQQQETSNLKQEIQRIKQSSDLMGKQANTEESKRALNEALIELNSVQKRLQEGTISLQAAQTEQTNVVTKLRKLEIPGAENLADYEKLFDSGGGNTVKATGAVINTVRKVLGK